MHLNYSHVYTCAHTINVIHSEYLIIEFPLHLKYFVKQKKTDVIEQWQENACQSHCEMIICII